MEKIEEYGLHTCATLVEFDCGSWTARKLDKQVTEETNERKNAAKDASRTNKNLLAGRPELKVIETFCSSTRAYVTRNTYDWSRGTHLLPMLNFQTFSEAMNKKENEFYELVEGFLAVYPTLITAQAMALGDMFDRNEFPSVDSLRRKFYFRVNYFPMPTSGDFRVQCGNDAQAYLKEQMERITAEREQALMKEMGARFMQQLERMSELLTLVEEEDGKQRKIYPSLLENAWEQIRMVEGLGVPEYVEAAKQLRNAILHVDSVKELKIPEVKTGVKKEVDAILNKFKIGEI